MNPPTIFALLKLFDKRDHAERFIDGHLYMNTVSYFREYRDTSGELRGDRYEGISGIFQPSQLGSVKIGSHEIEPKELSGPLLIHNRVPLNWNIFCMYSANSSGHEDGVSAETLADLKRAIQLHKKCFGLGEHMALVLNTPNFLERVKAAIAELGVGGAMGLVDYFDEDKYHGFFDTQRICFQKRQRFAHQREYRIVIDRKELSGAPYVLNVGSVADIAILTTPQEFNDKLELRLPDGSCA